MLRMLNFKSLNLILYLILTKNLPVTRSYTHENTGKDLYIIISHGFLIHSILETIKYVSLEKGMNIYYCGIEKLRTLESDQRTSTCHKLMVSVCNI